MSNWALQGGGRVPVGGNAGARTGVILSEPSAAHTVTAWQEIVDATPVPAAGLLVAIHSCYGGGRRGFVDLAVGASGAERLLVEALPIEPGANIPQAGGLSAPIFLPLSVAAGERLSVRWQVDSNGGAGLSRPDVMVHLLPPHPLAQTGATYAETFGLDRATTSGTLITAGTSWGAWVQLGTLTRRAFALIPCVLGGTSSNPRNTILVEFGVGVAPNQSPVVQQSLRIDTANQVGVSSFGHVVVDAPAGTALWARAAASAARTLNCHIIALS